MTSGAAPYADDDIIAISALAHYSYCARRCALIHVEAEFEDNVYTLRGQREHERTDTVSWQTVPGGRLERALPLWSDRLGLSGRADAVEFREDGSIYPVEYKHGPRRPSHHDDIQLCAQAACLEEMLGRPVTGGAVYHVASRQRREVAITPALRGEMEGAIDAIRAMLREGRTPAPVNDARCPNCSLNDVCVPAVAVDTRYAWHVRQLYVAEPEDEL